MGVPIELFCCYSREDEDDLKKLFQQLRALERANLIHVWYDRAINPGENWEEAIHTHLESAQMILLMVSASFIASDQCYDKEMPRALSRHESGQARVLPVLLHPCDWKITPLGRFQVLPTDGQPISLWPNQNSALLNVIEGVKRTANELQVEMLLKAGLAHYDAEHYNEALAVFDQALLLAQPQEEPIVPAPLLGRLYQGKGDAYFIKKSLSDETWKNTIADALTNYEKALHYDDSLLHSHEQRGRALFHLERYGEAISSLEEALTRGSLDPDVLFCKYETLRQLHRTDEALTFYERAYERWLSWGEPHLKAAQLFEDEGRFEQSLVVWERVISLIPDHSDGYLGKARVLECLERYEDALEVYEQARAMNLNTARLSLQEGLLLELMRQDQKAMDALDKAVQLQLGIGQGDDIFGAAQFGKQRLYERMAEKARTQVRELGYIGHYRPFCTLQDESSIMSLAFSPDGRFLVSASGDWIPVKLWDLSSGKVQRTFEKKDPRKSGPYELQRVGAIGVAFSPDNRFLVSCGEETIALWDLSTGNESRVLEEGARSVAFSPDSHLLASCVGKTVKLWDLSSGRILRTFQYTGVFSVNRDWTAQSVAFSPDGRFLASIAVDLLSWSVVLWDLSSGRVLRTHEGMRRAAFSPDGRSFATAKDTQGVGIAFWDLSSGTHIQHLWHRGDAYVWDILFSSDGRTLISLEVDLHSKPRKETITVWDLSLKSEQQIIKSPRDSDLSCIALSPDGYTLAHGNRHGAIKLWRLL
jgi:tetratricopeptide (TPR) repeat protein